MRAVKLYNDQKFLREQYIDQEKPSTQIAKEIGCCDLTVRVKLRFRGIPIRDRHHQFPGNHVDLTEDLLEYLDGTLLGDGCLTPKTVVSARYSLGQKHLSYLLWVSDFLSRHGLKQMGRIRPYRKILFSKRKNQNIIYYSHNYSSCSYRELRGQYDRWYPGGKKRIPEDVKLTPLSIRTWFLEDGTVERDKRSKGAKVVTLCTDSFTDRGRKILIDALKERLDTAHVHIRAGNRIAFGAKETVRKFFDYILPLSQELEADYGYKYR